MGRQPTTRLLDPQVEKAIRWRRNWSWRTYKRYAGSWVAIRGRRVIATGKTYAALADALDERGRVPAYVCRVRAPGLVVY